MTFAAVAQQPDPPLEDLAFALAAEFGACDEAAARAHLDWYAAEVRDAPGSDAERLTAVLGRRHGFTGDRDHYDDPVNSMLDRVLERRRGLPILLSAVYVAVGRRAGIGVDGIGLPGHFVVAVGPQLLDPFDRGAPLPGTPPAPWPPKDIAMRMLNNLVGAYERRGNLAHALTAAELRLHLPAEPALRDTLDSELGVLRARLN